jgi:hypothetical protein
VVDCLVQATIEIDKRIARPEVLLEFVTRYYFARVCQQEPENLERLVPQFEPQALFAQFARVQVDFKHPKADRAVIPGHARSQVNEYTRFFTCPDKALVSGGLDGNSGGTQKAPVVD